MHPIRMKERVTPMLSPFLTRPATALLPLLLASLLPFAQAAAPPTPMAADMHKAKGVGCVDCHGTAKKKTFVPAQTCLRCHGPAEDLVKKTAAVKPENPHDSPHWGPTMECNICHRQHEKPVNWCNHCHAYGFKVP